MGYRKVTYTEQIWYIIKYQLQRLFRRRKCKHAEETEDTV